MARAFVPIQIQQSWLALDAGFVQEILGERPWVPVPGASSQLPGVVAWRGRAVAVLDLGALAGVGNPLRSGEVRARMVVIQSDPVTLAIPVASVREVQEVDDNQLQAPHATKLPYSSSEVELYGTPMPVIDLPAIVEAVSALAQDNQA